MIRVCALAILLAAPLSAQVVTPAPVPAVAAPAIPTTFPTRAPATRPSPDQLHRQAYQFMLAGKFDKATPLLNRAYNETDPNRRGRSLVLNRAVLDLVQKGNPMRGVKDLNEYLSREPAPDEEASNVLGCLLELASRTPKLKDSPIYADAFREFARREVVLERYRPGFKRWGPKWVTEQEYDAIKARDRELEVALTEQAAVINRVGDNIKSTTVQYDSAYREVTSFSNHSHAVPGNGLRKRQTNSIYDLNNSAVADPAACEQCRAMNNAKQTAHELYAELQALDKQRSREQSRYDQMKGRLTKPTWPPRYGPVDPDAPPPKPPETVVPSEPAAANEPVGDPSTTGAMPDIAPATSQPSELIR